MTSDRLFTARFFMMCGFTFTVFLSVFQLIPVSPFHITDLGGGPLASGLFLGFLTFASAWSAPLTGALADRIGRRRTLILASLALAGFTTSYAFIERVPLLLGLVLLHGIVWSSLLSASAAYMTGVLPPSRRAEGIAYWGLATVLAMAVAPSLGFWIYRRSWAWLCAGTTLLNLGMGVIAWSLHDDRAADAGARHHHDGSWIERRVLLLASPLFLCGYGYGTISSFSAVYTNALGVRPRALYLTTLAVVTLFTRPVLGRLGDRIGYRRMFIPCLVLIAAGLALLPPATTAAGLILSASVFAVGFGTSYPVFAAYVLQDISEARRGAAFGAILAAFDTGIGAGSTASGWLIGRAGFTTAFGTAAVLAALALPAFLLMDRYFGPRGVHSAVPPVPDAAGGF
ncbi:MAG TPA: MFS transporter [Vicinamibacterales bacterium]